MEAPPRRVRQCDVAEAAGVHRTTVCLALKNHPSIPAETRARIVRLAREMGYAPDPMLSALAQYRKRLQSPAFQGTLAWLVNSADGFNWKSFPHYYDYFRGARERAKFHGYTLDIFDLNSSGMAPERLAAILRARNITGILLCPQQKAGTEMNFPWDQVSSITFGFKLANPCLHTVTATHHRNMLRVMDELHLRGYRRIGFAFSKDHNEASDQNFLGGFLSEEIGYHKKSPAMPAFITSYRRDSTDIKAWIRRHQPDAIVTGEYMAFEILEKAGFRIPDDFGLVCPTLPSNATRLAGVVEDSSSIGAVAVDLLVAAINRDDRGIPKLAVRHLIEGFWHEGESLRPPHRPTVGKQNDK